MKACSRVLMLVLALLIPALSMTSTAAAAERPEISDSFAEDGDGEAILLTPLPAPPAEPAYHPENRPIPGALTHAAKPLLPPPNPSGLR